MIELTYTGDTVTVAANAGVPFNTVKKSSCAERFEADTNTLTLKHPGRYLVTATANIAVPTGGTVGAVSLSLASNATPINGTLATVTPAAVEEFFNVAMQAYIDVYCGCCKTVSLVNTSGIAVDVNNQNVIAVRVGGLEG